MKYVYFKSRKLWGGSVSVPSFLVEYAKRTQKKIKVEFEGQYMIIDPTDTYEVTAPTQTAQRTDQYIRKGKPYQLYDYKWSPHIEKNVMDYTNEGLGKLLSAWKALKRPKQNTLDFDK